MGVAPHLSSIPISQRKPSLLLQHCPRRIINTPPTLNTDIFLPKDDSSQAPDNEMDEVDMEIEDFKRFCFMCKPPAYRPIVAFKESMSYYHIKQSLTH